SPFADVAADRDVDRAIPGRRHCRAAEELPRWRSTIPQRRSPASPESPRQIEIAWQPNFVLLKALGRRRMAQVRRFVSTIVNNLAKHILEPVAMLVQSKRVRDAPSTLPHPLICRLV